MFTQHNTSLHNKLMHGLSASALILALAMPDMAQAEGWYGGVGFGNTKVKDNLCTGADTVFDPGFSCSSDNTDTGWKIFIGNQLNKNAAIEFGYVDLGEATFGASGNILGAASNLNGNFKAKGFNLALVGSLPVTNEFAVLGRIGLFRWDSDFSGGGNIGAISGSGSDSATGVDLTYGIGVKYDINKTIGLRAEWEKFKDVGDDNTTGQSDVDLLSLSLVFRFQ